MKLQTDKKALLILGRRNTMECVQKSFYGKTKSSDRKHSNNIVALSPFSLGPPIDASKQNRFIRCEGACIGIIQWNCKHLFLHIACSTNDRRQWTNAIDGSTSHTEWERWRYEGFSSCSQNEMFLFLRYYRSKICAPYAKDDDNNDDAVIAFGSKHLAAALGGGLMKNWFKWLNIKRKTDISKTTLDD